MDSVFLKRLLLLDDPEYIEMINQVTSCFKGGQPYDSLVPWYNFCEEAERVKY